MSTKVSSREYLRHGAYLTITALLSGDLIQSEFKSSCRWPREIPQQVHNDISLALDSLAAIWPQHHHSCRLYKLGVVRDQ